MLANTLNADKYWKNPPKSKKSRAETKQVHFVLFKDSINSLALKLIFLVI